LGTTLGCGAPTPEETSELGQTRQALVFGPDFIVREVSAPPSVFQGGTLPVTVTVCNQGTDGDTANLELFLYPDRVMSVNDSPLDSTFVSWLNGGECETNTFYTSASLPDGAWYVGAIADTYNSSPETNETNNARTGPLVGIGSAPDFFISSVTVPASLSPGEPFTSTVTVCNQGTVRGGAEVQLVLSEDSIIRFSDDAPPESQDLPVFSFSADDLEPGQCRKQQVPLSLSAPHDGAWYLGAVAIPSHSLQELISSNNTRASELFGLGALPDFVIQSVSGPASALSGQDFTASVTVCNQGTESGSTQVQLVLSADTSIRFSPELPPDGQDQPLASFPSGALVPGQCKTQQVQASASVPEDGPWYLGAVVDPNLEDPELIETNNALASKPMGFGALPDFVIQAVSGPPSAAPGELFMASVTVCNQGTVPGGTQVQLVLSQDTTIRYTTTEPPQGQDQPMASFSSGPLEPGQCKTEQVETSAQPMRYGAFYLGAVADPGLTTPELIETNNTRASKVFGVGRLPDFIVQAVSGPASVMPGQPFTVKVTLCNQGTESGRTGAHLVLSEDTDIRFSYDAPSASQDSLLTFLDSGHLEAGQCQTQQVIVHTGIPLEGPWYVGVVADAERTRQELVETNNTRASGLIGYGHAPDLIIQAISGPPSVLPGQPFTASVTVCNQGTLPGHAEVTMVLSEDTDIRFSPNAHPESQDVMAGMVHLPGSLEPGQCKTVPAHLGAHVPHEGAWYLGAVADPGQYEQELIETNNTRAGELLGIGMQADYVVQSVSVPPSIMPGDMFTATVTVCNQGTVPGRTELQLVVSQDADIRFSYDAPPDSQDLPLVGFPTGPLEAGQCKAVPVQLSAWVPNSGAWYLGAVADPGRYDPELIETNNTRASTLIGIGYDADYLIQSVNVPASVLPGHPFTASLTVCNQGYSGGSADVQLVLSEDTDIRFSPNAPPSSQDLPLVQVRIRELGPGQCRTQQVELTAQAPRDGAWYLGAVADPHNATPELIETNNLRASKAFGIGHRADFVIQSVSGPASSYMGEDFTASVTVCNQGTAPGETQMQLVLSADTTIRFSDNAPPYSQDLPLERFSTSRLEPGQCKAQQVLAYAQAQDEGLWYLGAVADPGNSVQELIETNNTRASTPMGIGYRSDLVIQAVSGPVSVTPSQDFTASVTVCNQGTRSAPADVMLVLSEDADIRFSYSGPPESQDHYLTPVPFQGELEPGQCKTQQLVTGAWAPHDGTWYLGAVVDPGNYEHEFIETNNALASKPFGIGYRADFVIQAVSGPASVKPGDPFTVDVTVCNQGTTSAPVDVQVVLSEDTTIRFSYNGPPENQDLLLNGFYLESLPAGQCRTQQVQTATSVPHEGAWYLGAVADPGHSENEFLETNNTLAGKAIGIGHLADFTVTAVNGPASARPGDLLTATVTVCNQGTVSGSTQVQLVLSADTTIRFSNNGPPHEQDLPLTSFPTGTLASGQCTTQQVQTSAQPPQEGAWYLGAVADPGNSVQELMETNNTRASKVLGIGLQADFTITTVSGPASVRPGDPFTAKVTVCNQGTVSGSTEVQLVVSADTTLRFSYDGPSFEEDYPLDSFPTGTLAAGQCTTQQVQTYAYAPFEGTWYLGALADPLNSVQELIETNNTRASALIGIGHAPDLIIRELTGPASVALDQPYGVTVKVCNQGTVPSNAEVQLVLSKDTDIRFAYDAPPESQDLPVEYLSFSNLAPGQCIQQGVALSMHPPEGGSWYVGAVADPGRSLPEFIETNNTRASGAIAFQP
jgi:subtilase family serine protease